MTNATLSTLRVKIIAALSAAVLWALSRTWKVEVLPSTAARELWTANAPFILAFWHNRQLMMPRVAEVINPPGSPVCALISRHSDGRIIAEAIRYLGLDSVAGSSTRGGSSSLRELLRRYRRGQTIAITPDGPRGPLYKLKSGILSLGRLSGKPIYPFACRASRAWVFGSWDRMMLPKPFATLWVYVGPGLEVAEVNEEQRLEFERRLNEATGVVDGLA